MSDSPRALGTTDVRLHCAVLAVAPSNAPDADMFMREDQRDWRGNWSLTIAGNRTLDRYKPVRCLVRQWSRTPTQFFGASSVERP